MSAPTHESQLFCSPQSIKRKTRFESDPSASLLESDNPLGKTKKCGKTKRSVAAVLHPHACLDLDRLWAAIRVRIQKLRTMPAERSSGMRSRAARQVCGSSLGR